MQLNFVYDPSVASAPAGFQTALNEAAGIVSQNVLNPETVTIDIGWGLVPGDGPLTDGTLAAAGPTGQSVSYDQLVAALKSNPDPSLADQSFLASLPATDPGPGGNTDWFLPTAEAKALGVVPAFTNEVDGVLGVNAGVNWDFTQSDGTTAGQFDLVGTLLHELTHAMGRITESANGFITPLSLTRYDNAGQLSINDPPPHANFSMDGGMTFLAGYADTSDFGDLDGTTGGPSGSPLIDPFNAFLDPSTTYSWSGGPNGIDSLTMQALGFTTLDQQNAPNNPPNPKHPPKMPYPPHDPHDPSSALMAGTDGMTTSDFVIPGMDVANLPMMGGGGGASAAYWDPNWSTMPPLAPVGSST